jgi:hypothetical protein
VEQWVQSCLTSDVVWSQAFIFVISPAVTIDIGQLFGVSVGGDSSVGTATLYGLDGAGIESRWWARFYGLVQTGCGSHLASCTMSTGFFPGVKRPGRDVDHPPHLAPRFKEEHSYNCTPHWAFVACSRANFFYFVRKQVKLQCPKPEVGLWLYLTARHLTRYWANSILFLSSPQHVYLRLFLKLFFHLSRLSKKPSSKILNAFLVLCFSPALKPRCRYRFN